MQRHILTGAICMVLGFLGGVSLDWFHLHRAAKQVASRPAQAEFALDAVEALLVSELQGVASYPTNNLGGRGKRFNQSESDLIMDDRIHLADGHDRGIFVTEARKRLEALINHLNSKPGTDVELIRCQLDGEFLVVEVVSRY